MKTEFSNAENTCPGESPSYFCKEGVGRLLAPPSLPWWWSTGVTPPSLDKCSDNDDHNVDTSSLGKMRVQIMVQTSQLPQPGNELSLVDPDTGEAEGNPTQTSSAPRVWPPVPVACFKTRGNSRGSENVVKVFSLYLSRHSKSFMCKRWIEFNEERRNLQMFFCACEDSVVSFSRRT